MYKIVHIESLLKEMFVFLQVGKTEAKHALESAKQSLKKRSAFSTKMVELVLPQDIVDQVQAGFTAALFVHGRIKASAQSLYT